MDINKLLTAGAWMTVYGVEGVDGLEPFQLKIAPFDPFPFLGEARSTDMIDAVLALIVGWDLRDGDKPAEFTPASKQILRRILFRRIKTEAGGFGGMLLDEILKFAAGPERLKNLRPISNGLSSGAAEPGQNR